MTTGHVYIATSLDGFVARADHRLDWLNRQPPPADGSDMGQLGQSFLREGLIEDLTLTTVPVLIGEGKRLFGPLGGDIDLELVTSQAFDNGMVQTTWRVT